MLSMDDMVGGRYLRIRVKDHPGVLMNVTEILGQHQINIDALLQKSAGTVTAALILLLTSDVRERTLRDALSAIEALDDVVDKVTHIRVEHLA